MALGLRRRRVSLVRRVIGVVLDYGYATRQIVRAELLRRPAWASVEGEDGRLPVVLLPGIYESWRFLEPLGRLLHERGHPVGGVELGLNGADLDSAAARVIAHLDRLPAAGPVILLAHSKGGLIGHAVLLAAPGRVAGLVCVNTPFGGSSLARFIPTHGLRALTPAAILRRATKGSESLITSIGAIWDPHVPEGSRLIGAHNQSSPDIGHFRPISRPRTQRLVLDAVERIQRLDAR